MYPLSFNIKYSIFPVLRGVFIVSIFVDLFINIALLKYFNLVILSKSYKGLFNRATLISQIFNIARKPLETSGFFIFFKFQL